MLSLIVGLDPAGEV